MIIASKEFETMLNAIARELRARVELYNGSALLDTFTYDGALQSYVVERIGVANKFFGYGICQKLTVKLRDKERLINVEKGQGLEVVLGVKSEYIYTCPIFYIEEVTRDENTNELTIIAYDSLYGATKHKISEVTISIPYTIKCLAHACGSVLGVPVVIEDDNTLFDVEYPNGANINGDESIREILDDIAEATGCIYYMCCNWNLTFKRLKIEDEPVLHIDKSKYFTLSSKTSHTLQSITSATELGDNITASTGIDGEHQYLRDNAFLDIREDANTLLENILASVGGLTIVQFDIKWRGNVLLEIGDKISIETKDGSIIETYILSDTITYNGGLFGNTSWEYSSSEAETSSNPSTLSDVIKQTYARVDKVNQTVDIVASNVENNTQNISSLQLTTSSLSASVSRQSTDLNTAVTNINNDIATLTSSVNAAITADDVQIQITEAMETNSVHSVTTTTGFTFNEEGLRVSKSGSAMESLLDEDGLTVYRDDTEVLTADNTGVNVLNANVRQFLIVGGSRFEAYGDDRTGCFWIGG